MSRGKAKTVEQLKLEAELKIKTAQAKEAFKAFINAPSPDTLVALSNATNAIVKQQENVSDNVA